MAPNPAPVASQQATQAALASLMAAPIDRAWQTFNPSDPSTLPTFIQAITALVRQFGRVSGAQAAKAYVAERKAAGVVGTYSPKMAATADTAKVDKSVRWATSPLWQPNPDIATVRGRVGSVAEKSVLDVGRQTTIDNVRSDRKAHGWAREVEPGSCSFCALLATRGAVYRSDASASFQSHDNCRCFAVPTFTAYEPTAQVREWQALYRQSTRGVRGGDAQRNAFRQAFDAHTAAQQSTPA